MYISNREALQNLSSGVCPSPTQAPVQTVVVQPAYDDCKTTACPSPTREGVKIDTTKLFTEDCGEIVFGVRNVGDTTETIRIGLRSVPGSFYADGTSPTGVDLAFIQSTEEDYNTGGLVGANIPKIEYFNWGSTAIPVIVSKITITNISTSAQRNEKLNVITRSLDATEDECFKKIAPQVCPICPGVDEDPDNRMVEFGGPFAFDFKNGVEYRIHAAQEIEIRLCIAGEADVREFSPCE